MTPFLKKKKKKNSCKYLISILVHHKLVLLILMSEMAYTKGGLASSGQECLLDSELLKAYTAMKYQYIAPI